MVTKERTYISPNDPIPSGWKEAWVKINENIV